MVSPKTRSQYKATIGIECHVQLKTKTKLFSAVSNDARSAQPNTLISHIDLGMPGALPVLNEAAVKSAIKVAFAFGVRPQKTSYFERKHYFYPDLPKGYQITQLAKPIIVGGRVEIQVGGKQKVVNLNRVQLEEDAGKSTHPAGKDYSLVDLNRAGTPLLEIVSEPDMHSAEEAKAFARELWLILRYSGVSDADLYQGNMRFDVNVSVSKTDELGTRSETKNLNSFRSVEKAVDYEIKRQIELLEKGQKVVQETRGWDDAKQRTFSQRTKEEAHDYRYFPEPDLPPIVLTDDEIDKVGKTMPTLPNSYREAFKVLNLDSASVEFLIDSPENSAFIQQVLDNNGAKHAKRIANWLVNVTSKDQMLNQDKIIKVSVNDAVKLSELVEASQLNSSAAKEIWNEISYKGGDSVKIAQSRNLLQESDETKILEIVKGVLSENEQAAKDVKRGEMKAVGFLVGQVMKASKGQANPEVAQKLIKQHLED